MLIFILAYTLICGALLTLTVAVAAVNFSGFRHHRVREVSHYLESQETESGDAPKVESPKRTIIQEADDWLRTLDYPLQLNGRTFMLLELAYVVLLGSSGAWGLIQSSLYRSVAGGGLLGVIMIWAIFAFAAVLLFLLPLLVLRAMAGRRIRKIRRQFGYLLNYFRMFLRMGVQPDAIVKQTFRIMENPMRKRLVHLHAEIQVLGPREAFTRFANRLAESTGDSTKNREYKVFRDSIVNALDYGTDAAEACGRLSKDMRIKKKHESLQMIKRKPFAVILPKILFASAILMMITIPVLQKLFEFVNNS